MGCNPTAAAVCFFAILALASYTSTNRLTHTSVRRNFTSERLVWSVRGLVLQPRHSGQHKSCCRWCQALSSPMDSKQGGKRRCDCTSGSGRAQCFFRHSSRNSTSWSFFRRKLQGLRLPGVLGELSTRQPNAICTWLLRICPADSGL